MDPCDVVNNFLDLQRPSVFRHPVLSRPELGGVFWTTNNDVVVTTDVGESVEVDLGE